MIPTRIPTRLFVDLTKWMDSEVSHRVFRGPSMSKRSVGVGQKRAVLLNRLTGVTLVE